MGEKRDYQRNYHFHRYQAKPFRNPYFQAPHRNIDPKRFLLPAAGLGVIIGLLYLIGFAPFWMIKDVRLEGLQFISAADVRSLAESELAGHRLLIFPERNRLFFDADHLKERLDAQYAFEELRVGVEKRVLTIVVKERVSQVLWQTGDTTFYTDVDGTIIRAVPDEDSPLLAFHDTTQPILEGRVVEGPYPKLIHFNSLPLIVNEDAKEIAPGAKVLNEKRLAAIITMAQKMRERGWAVKQFRVEHADSAWAKAVTLEGFDVLFDAEADIEAQLGYLAAVLEQDVPNRSVLDYVDVRFGNHVYFKNK